MAWGSAHPAVPGRGPWRPHLLKVRCLQLTFKASRTSFSLFWGTS